MTSLPPMEKVCNVFTVVNGLSTMKVKKAASDTEKRLNFEQNLTSYEFGNMLAASASLRTLCTPSGCSNKAQFQPGTLQVLEQTSGGRGVLDQHRHCDLAHTLIHNLTLSYERMKNCHVPEEDTAMGCKEPCSLLGCVQVFL